MIKKTLLLLTLGITLPSFGAPLVVTDTHNRVYENLIISNPKGHCITVKSAASITIRNSTIGPCGGVGVYINKSKNVTIESNRLFEVAGGVYAVNSSTVAVQTNEFYNVSKGNTSRGQFVQFNRVSGKENKINYNTGENIFGSSDPEDLVSLFKTHGTSESPIEVIGNRFRGGGPSKSGGGIMAGDFGGSHILIKDNVLVNPGQYGIAIAGGENIQVLNNEVFAEQRRFTNVGIYVAQWRGAASCKDHTVANNRVTWIKSNGKNNPQWKSSQCGEVKGWGTNDWRAGLTAEILPPNLFENEYEGEVEIEMTNTVSD